MAASENQLLSDKFTEGRWEVYITANRNILACGNISLKLFMPPLETLELLTFWYVVAEHHFAQLSEVSNF